MPPHGYYGEATESRNLPAPKGLGEAGTSGPLRTLTPINSIRGLASADRCSRLPQSPARLSLLLAQMRRQHCLPMSQISLKMQTTSKVIQQNLTRRIKSSSQKMSLPVCATLGGSPPSLVSLSVLWDLPDPIQPCSLGLSATRRTWRRGRATTQLERTRSAQQPLSGYTAARFSSRRQMQQYCRSLSQPRISPHSHPYPAPQSALVLTMMERCRFLPCWGFDNGGSTTLVGRRAHCYGANIDMLNYPG